MRGFRKTTPNDLEPLEKTLGYEFRKKGLLMSAVMRKAALQELPIYECDWHCSDSTCLNFLGNRVLSLLVETLSYKYNSKKTEGYLTQTLQKVLQRNRSTEGLIIDIARQFNLSEHLILGNGEKKQDVQKNPKVLAHHVQALFAAIWLDSNHDMIICLRVFLLGLKIPEEKITTTLQRPFLFGSAMDKIHFNADKFIALQKTLYIFDHQQLLVQAMTRQSALEDRKIEKLLAPSQSVPDGLDEFPKLPKKEKTDPQMHREDSEPKVNQNSYAAATASSLQKTHMKPKKSDTSKFKTAPQEDFPQDPPPLFWVGGSEAKSAHFS